MKYTIQLLIKISYSSNESTHYAPNRSGHSRNPRVPRTPRRVRPQRPPRFDRTPNERADSINGNVQHVPHQPKTPSDRHDIMSTMEQQHYRQQATMSTAHHNTGHHYGQHHTSSNVVDQTVTQTARDCAHTQGHNVSSAPNTRYAPYHRDINTAAPPYFIHRLRQCIKPKSTTPYGAPLCSQRASTTLSA